MRSTMVVFLLVCLGIAGCTSSSGLDGLGLSSDTTSSISVPRPSAAVAERAVPPPTQTAMTASVAAVAKANEPPVEPIAMLAPLGEAADSVAAQVAMAVPDKPAARAITRHRFRDAKPINFGKASPKQLPVHGVDISRWQGDIDWQQLRGQGANFVYIKATDGGDHLDPMFRKNWRAAEKAGLKRGAYHFFYWCRVASEQADWFIRNVPKVEGALPPVIDVEYNGQSSCKRRLSPETRREKMQVFMDRLEAHYGQRPMIYTAPDFYRDNLRGHFEHYPFWLRAVAQHPSKVYPGRKWVLWQYSGSGLSQGVKGRIDLNVFHGSEDMWRAWAG